MRAQLHLLANNLMSDILNALRKYTEKPSIWPHSTRWKLPLTEHVIAATTNALKRSLKPFTTAASGELSGMIGDQLRYQRWKNAIRILEKAKRFCTQNKIPEKSVPLKFIVPFLDASSLEEDVPSGKLSDLWASLLTSAVNASEAKHNLFIERLRSLSTLEANEISKLVRHLLKETEPNYNQFLDAEFEPDGWNIDMFEEFRFHIRQHIESTTFNFSQHRDYRYSITPEPALFIKRFVKKWPKSRQDFFVDYYSWNLFNEDGFYGGASDNYSLNSKFLSQATIDTLVALGLITREVQTFRVKIPRTDGYELRFDLRLGALTTLGLQFLRATHFNEFHRIEDRILPQRRRSAK